MKIISEQEYNNLKKIHVKKAYELKFIEQKLIDYERYQDRFNISNSLQPGYKLNFETMQIEKDKNYENFTYCNR
jgi:hypothetical protein